MADCTRLLVVTGEASGDLHAGSVVRELLARLPHLRVAAMGGSNLKAAGAEIIRDISDMQLMGFVEVVRGVFGIRRAFRCVMDFVKRAGVVGAVLVDYPGFNIRLAKYLKRLKIPVVYYISPQVWVWHSSRAKEIARLVRKMLVIFPFEEELYRRVGADVSFVGHPLLDLLAPAGKSDGEEIRRRLDLSPKERLVALLPGSREQVVSRHAGLFARASEIMRRADGSLRFVLSESESLPEGTVAEVLKSEGLDAKKVPVVRGSTHELIRGSQAAVASSGTTTLECALLETPPVVCYRTSPLNYLIGRLVVRIPHISLVNIAAGKKLVPELLQSRATPKRIAAETLALLNNDALRAETLAGMKDIAAKLGSPGAASRAAQEIITALDLQ